MNVETENVIAMARRLLEASNGQPALFWDRLNDLDVALAELDDAAGELAGVSCDYAMGVGENPCDLNSGHKGPHHHRARPVSVDFGIQTLEGHIP